MTATFEAILEQKKDSIIKLMDALQELTGQPVIYPPDEELRKCSSPELVYLIALHEQVKSLEAHAKTVAHVILHVSNHRLAVQEVLKALGKLDDSKGGASLGW
mgnify:CR=1 FL=1